MGHEKEEWNGRNSEPNPTKPTVKIQQTVKNSSEDEDSLLLMILLPMISILMLIFMIYLMNRDIIVG